MDKSQHKQCKRAVELLRREAMHVSQTRMGCNWLLDLLHAKQPEKKWIELTSLFINPLHTQRMLVAVHTVLLFPDASLAKMVLLLSF